MDSQQLRWWWHVWPGLAQVMTGRESDGLVRALVFAALINAGVLCTFVWAGRVPERVTQGIWIVAAAFWAGSALQTLWASRRRESPESVERREALYRMALRALVQREWKSAQECASEVLRMRPTDADAAMLVGTACLLGGDKPRALLYFDRARSTGGGKWDWQVQHMVAVWGNPPPADDGQGDDGEAYTGDEENAAAVGQQGRAFDD